MFFMQLQVYISQFWLYIKPFQLYIYNYILIKKLQLHFIYFLSHGGIKLPCKPASQ